MIENLGNSEAFHSSFVLINRTLTQLRDVLRMLVAIDTQKSEPARFDQFLAGLRHVLEAIADGKPSRTAVLNTVLEQVDPILRKVIEAPVFQLRLGVTLAELVDFLICVHNILFISPAEIETGLTLVFNAVSPAFPLAGEIRDDLARLLQAHGAPALS
jgi:hypothetical protein